MQDCPLRNQNGTLRRGHAQKGLPRRHTHGLSDKHYGFAGAPPAVQDRDTWDGTIGLNTNVCTGWGIALSGAFRFF